jgi:hypothetical protein
MSIKPALTEHRLSTNGQCGQALHRGVDLCRLLRGQRRRIGYLRECFRSGLSDLRHDAVLQGVSHQEAKQFALDCALGICQARGPLGQWWWHYDSVRGRVADGCRVFSVHQHTMGPMTLFALGETFEDLKVLFECRPYELGWLLYAFAGRADPDLAFAVASDAGAGQVHKFRSAAPVG